MFLVSHRGIDYQQPGTNIHLEQQLLKGRERFTMIDFEQNMECLLHDVSAKLVSLRGVEASQIIYTNNRLWGRAVAVSLYSPCGMYVTVQDAGVATRASGCPHDTGRILAGNNTASQSLEIPLGAKIDTVLARFAQMSPEITKLGFYAGYATGYRHLKIA